LNATLEFNYADAELNGLPEDALTLFRSDDGGNSYSAAGYFKRETQNNNIILTGIDSFARFTAAAPDLFNYGSLALNGVDNYLDISSIASDIAGSNTFSVSFWVKPDFANQTDANGVAPFALNDASGNDIFYILIGAPGTQDKVVRVFDSSGLPKITGPALSGDTWHHISFTYDNGTSTLYVDGQSRGQSSMSVTLSSDDQWSISQKFNSGTPGDFLDGNIDEVRIWNQALTAQQLRDNTFQPLKGNETGLIGYYPLNNTATGSSSNSNDGTLKNSPSFDSDTYPNGTFITGSEGWHMMSAPISGASYSTLLDTLWLQGISQGGDITAGTANLYNWDESTYQFNAIDDATINIPASEGFIFYVYNDQDYDGTADGFPKMIQTSQPHRSGNFSPSLSFTSQSDPSKEGWNLTGNPYAATINWDAPNGWTKTNLESSIYVWDETANSGSGAYLSWNGSTGTLPNGLIAPWQAFWVKANASSPVLKFTDEVRSAGGVFYKESEKQKIPQIVFDLKGSKLNSKAVMMFSDKAKTDKEPLDAWKLESLNPRYLSLYTTDTDRHALDINALPSDLDSPVKLNLDFKGSDLGGKYTLSWNPKALPSDITIELTDLKTNRVIDLNESGEYSFEIEAENTRPKSNQSSQKSTLNRPKHGPIPTVLKTKAKNSRFKLTVSPKKGNAVSPADIPSSVELNQNYPNPFNPTTVIRYGVPAKTQVKLSIYNVLGQRVQTLINAQKSPGRYQVSFDGSHLASGLYFYKLRVGSKILTKKMMLIK